MKADGYVRICAGSQCCWGCARAVAASGKRRSKQIRLPTRPTGVSKGGMSADPARVCADSRRLP